MVWVWMEFCIPLPTDCNAIPDNGIRGLVVSEMRKCANRYTLWSFTKKGGKTMNYNIPLKTKNRNLQSAKIIVTKKIIGFTIHIYFE